MSNVVEISNADLVAAVKILELAPQRAGVPASDFVRVEYRENDIEMAVSSSVNALTRIKKKGQAEPIEFCIDRRVLAPFVLAGSSSQDFRATCEEGVWKLRQGSRRAELAMRSQLATGYGTWKELDAKKEVKITAALRSVLLAAGNCATADPATQHLNCVHIGEKLVLATDLRLMFREMCPDAKAFSFPFPAGIIPLLGEQKVVGVSVVGDTVSLDCGVGYIECMVSAVAKAGFPAKEIMEQMDKGRKWEPAGKIPAKQLTDALKRLIEYLGAIKREDWLLRLELGGGEVKATVRVNQGMFKEKFSADIDKEVALELPLDRVVPVLEHMEKQVEAIEVRTEGNEYPYFFSGGATELLVSRKA